MFWNKKEDIELIEKKEDIERKIKEIEDFRKDGEKFKYMGVEMIKTGNMYLSGFYLDPTPCIHADYVDKNGVIHNATFNYSELDVLITENKTGKETEKTEDSYRKLAKPFTNGY